ncbi:MAG: hypothetical protein IT578_10540 [Verrucomicrobiae bacterium]|nr:hypothetical protein [Verrucomicrobiae bacterium]
MFLLNGKFQEFDWSMHAWGRILELACAHGWRPAGTRLQESTCRFIGKDGDTCLERWPLMRWSRRWKGGYDSNDAQIVTARDARAMAAALAKSLRHIPDEEILPRKKAKVDKEEEEVHSYFSGRINKNNLRVFIRFCRAGAFQIR